MKKSVAGLICSISLTLAGIAPAVPPARTGTLIVEADGLKSRQPVYFGLWNSKAGFLDTSVALKSVRKTVDRGRAIWVINNLSYGDYAVSAWQDLNGNGKLDSYFFGAPKEPVGSTNNARGSFGPPVYEDAKISFNRYHRRVRFTLKCPISCLK